MLTSRLLLSAVTSAPRHSFVTDLSSTVNQFGWVVAFHQFSNTAVALHFELPAHGLEGLSSALQSLPLHFSSESTAVLCALGDADLSALPDPLPGSINVTFFHSEPDLRIPVPAVPG